MDKGEIKKVCRECGIEANRLTCLEKYGQEPTRKMAEYCTENIDYCDCCGEFTWVTDIRNFFYPRFKLLKKIKKAKLNEEEMAKKRQDLLNEIQK